MNCLYFQENIDRLFDPETPEDIREEMLRHTNECPVCRNVYERSTEALSSVTPRTSPQVSPTLRIRILEAAATLPCRKNRALGLLRPLCAAAAVIAFACLLFDPAGAIKAYGAKQVFHTAAGQFPKGASFYMEVDIRTVPVDNFAFINAELPFVRHHIWVSPGKWRVDKEGRIALNDGEHIRAWVVGSQRGTVYNSAAQALDGLELALDPQGLLLSEEAGASRNKKANYQKTVSEDFITLSLTVPAEGDFTNDYMLNTSIGESDSRREYRFDRKTGRLTDIQISILVEGQDVPIVRMARIDYDPRTADTLFSSWPKDISWLDLSAPIAGTHFKGITAEEAARKFFAAAQSWDTTLLSEILIYYDLDKLAPNYKGCRLLEMGKAFRSGQYPGLFIPCTVALPDNSIQKIKLALRNDNDSGAWCIDGGI